MLYFQKGDVLTLMSIIKIAAPGLLLLILAGSSFSQTPGKTQTAPPQAGSPASAPSAKPPVQSEEEDVIPPAEPNATFPAVVAKVNGKAISGRDLEVIIRRELASIGNPEWKNLREDYRGQLTLNGLTSLINTKLLYQKALASGIKATDAEVQADLQRIAKTYKSDAEMNAALADQLMDREALQKNLYQSIAVAKYVDENVAKKALVTPDEVTKYYTGHPNE
jgi:parvulin-like peptidyl-prolyl isomerase